MELRRWLVSLEDDEVDVLEKRRDGGYCSEVVLEYDRVLAAHKHGYAASSPSSPPTPSSSVGAPSVVYPLYVPSSTFTAGSSAVPVPVLPTPTAAPVPVPVVTPTFYLNSRNLSTNSEMHRTRGGSSTSMMTVNFSDSVRDKDRDWESSSRCNSEEQSFESVASFLPCYASSLHLATAAAGSATSPDALSVPVYSSEDPEEEYFCSNAAHTASDVVQFILADD